MILDLRGLVWNAYYAGMSREPLRGEIKDEVNTAEYGFATFLNKFFNPMLEIVESPLHMVAVEDDGHLYRQSLYSEYKADREVAKDQRDKVELAQIDKAYNYAASFLKALGVPLVKLRNQEADDVIAFLVEKLHTRFPCIVSSIDKDMLQLYPKANIFRNGAIQTTFVEGVPSNLIALYLSIVGDSSDGFPGVVGLGPKAFESLYNTFGEAGLLKIQGFLETKDKASFRAAVEPSGHKVGMKLLAEWDRWGVQLHLAKLHPEICDDVKAVLQWIKRCPSHSRLTQVMESAGALDMVGQYEKFCYTQTLVTMDNLDDCLEEVIRLLPETPCVPFDYESYDPSPETEKLKLLKKMDYVNPLAQKITGASFCLGNNLQHVYYFSSGHKDTANLPLSYIKGMLLTVEGHGLDTVAHNCMFEATLSRTNFNHELKSWQDVRCYSHQINENTPNDLKSLSLEYLNYKQTSYNQLMTQLGVENMSQVTGQEVLAYGCDDSLVTGHLYYFFILLTCLEDTFEFTRDYECNALALMKEPHIHGIQFDPAEIQKQHEQDQATCDANYSKVLSLLEQHCLEPNYAGVQMIYEDQKAYVAYKARKAYRDKNPSSTFEEQEAQAKVALAKFKEKLLKSCVYIIPYEASVQEAFIPTPVKLTRVAGFLGFPEITKVSKAGISDYLSDLERPPAPNLKQDIFCELLGLAASQFNKREGEYYEKFKSFCELVLSENTPKRMEGTLLSLDSPTQLSSVFYLMLGLPIRIRTDVQKGSVRSEAGLPGNPSTDDSALDFALANDCGGDNAWKGEVLRAISTYCKASTRISNYWKPYPLWLGRDNLIHPSFLSPGTVTRRPTGSNPNMLQVSKSEVRRIVKPRCPDNVIVSVDFASQELRVLASVTRDANFLSAYIHGPEEDDKDLHTMTSCGIALPLARRKEGDLSSRIPSNPDGKVDYAWYLALLDALDKGTLEDTSLGKFLKWVRGIGKKANFGAGYGGTAQTVSIQCMIPIEDAELAVNGLMATYPGIPKWKQVIYKFAREHGYVATTYGSRRHCGMGLLQGTRSQIGRWERQLANFLIQGQCGDLLKVVLTEAYKEKLFQETGAYLLAPIYDEILSEVPKKHVFEYIERLSAIMQIYMPGVIVPMVADWSLGHTWWDQIQLGSNPTRERVEEALASLPEVEYRSAMLAAPPGELENTPAPGEGWLSIRGTNASLL